jgi:amidophosphoribosyltransferase
VKITGVRATLCWQGNFNLTNTDEIYDALVELGQHPKDYSDTVSILENVGHFLDEENQLLFRQFKNEGFKNREISSFIERDLDVRKNPGALQ